MPANLVYTDEAKDDVAAAYAFLEGKRTGLGDEFLARVNRAVTPVLANPLIHQIVHGSYRKAVVRQFTYVVIYAYEDAADVVTVAAVHHTSMHPSRWMSRLPPDAP